MTQHPNLKTRIQPMPTDPARRPASHRRARLRQDIVSLQIEDFPVDLKRKLVAFADAQGTNMNDVAVTLLAREFQVTFVPSGRQPPVEARDGGAVAFKMPRKLRIKISNHAATREIPKRQVVIDTLRKAFK